MGVPRGKVYNMLHLKINPIGMGGVAAVTAYRLGSKSCKVNPRCKAFVG